MGRVNRIFRLKAAILKARLGGEASKSKPSGRIQKARRGLRLAPEGDRTMIRTDLAASRPKNAATSREKTFYPPSAEISVCTCGQTLLSVFDIYFLETCDDCLREEIRENPHFGRALGVC
jgi:hypothetical protein